MGRAEFAYNADVAVTIAPWWGTGHYVAPAFVWHLPTGASAHLMGETVIMSDYPGTLVPTPAPAGQERFGWFYSGDASGIADLQEALGDQGLRNKIDAWVKLRLGVWKGPDDFAERPALVLWAEPTDDPQTKLLKAQIIGGAEYYSAHYCGAFEWRDGVGGSIITPETCQQVDGGYKITGEFEQIVRYSRPGSYDASLWIRTTAGLTLSALTTIEVP